MGRRLGLIIGINSYEDVAFRPLQYAETDSRALAQWLVNAQGGNWSPSDVQHVQGTYATRELVETLIAQTCVTVAEPGDLVLIYFAGHGFLDERTGDGYLALANTRYTSPVTGIHLPSLMEKALGRTRASEVIFLLDYFQSGRLWSQRRATAYDSTPLLGPAILRGLQQIPNRMVFCSCRGNELAREAGEKNLGVFAYRTIVGLCGPASDPATGQITMQRLYAYLSNALGEQQRPQLFGQATQSIVLVGATPSPPSPSYQASGPFSAQPNAPIFPASQGSGLRMSAVQPNATGTLLAQAPDIFAPAAAPQLSPTTSGQIAIQAAEDQSAMLLRQARHLIQMQNPGEAFKYIEQALQINPMNSEALLVKAQLLGAVDRSQEALAAVEQAIQLNPHNALAWSVRGVLLSNMEQYQAALQAIDRSLELDPNNIETHAIKTRIMDHIAMLHSIQQDRRQRGAGAERRGGPRSFAIAVAITILGLIIGGAGAALPVIRPTLPIWLALGLQSVGLALLCVNAVRGSFLYGFTRVLLAFVFSALIAAMLGGLYKFGLGHFYRMAQANPPILVPILFSASWFAVASALPLALAIVAFIPGVITRIVGRRRK
jgi:tetratricopeptide (TPR) repeat protein